MKQLLLLLLCAVLLVSITYAQEIKKATQQDWAGGVCCATGTNYVVTIETDFSADAVSLREIWLNNYGQVTGGILSDGPDPGTLTLSFGTYSNKRSMEDSEEEDRNKEKMPNFEGEALITLKKCIKTIRLEVDSFETLMMLAYP